MKCYAKAINEKLIELKTSATTLVHIRHFHARRECGAASRIFPILVMKTAPSRVCARVSLFH
jgi:hypothetical protein